MSEMKIVRPRMDDMVESGTRRTGRDDQPQTIRGRTEQGYTQQSRTQQATILGKWEGGGVHDGRREQSLTVVAVVGWDFC